MCQKNHPLTTFADRVKVFEYLWLEKDQFQSMYHLTKHTAWKVCKYRVFSGPYFPIFGLNTEIYSVNLRIQSEYRKIRTGPEKTLYLDTFHTVIRLKMLKHLQTLKLKFFKGAKEQGQEREKGRKSEGKQSQNHALFIAFSKFMTS